MGGFEIDGWRLRTSLRGPGGTDPLTTHALRRNLDGDINAFPRDVVELREYLRDAKSGQRVHAVPGEGSNVPICPDLG